MCEYEVKANRKFSEISQEMVDSQSMLRVVRAVRGAGRAALRASHFSLTPLSSAATISVVVTLLTPPRTADCATSSLSFLYSLSEGGKRDQRIERNQVRNS